MPYIAQEDRRALDPAIEKLVDAVGREQSSTREAFEGYLNYALTRLVLGVVPGAPLRLDRPRHGRAREREAGVLPPLRRALRGRADREVRRRLLIRGWRPCAFASAAEFAEVAFPYLERHEAEHNLVPRPDRARRLRRQGRPGRGIRTAALLGGAGRWRDRRCSAGDAASRSRPQPLPTRRRSRAGGVPPRRRHRAAGSHRAAFEPADEFAAAWAAATSADLSSCGGNGSTSCGR